MAWFRPTLTSNKLGEVVGICFVCADALPPSQQFSDMLTFSCHVPALNILLKDNPFSVKTDSVAS